MSRTKAAESERKILSVMESVFVERSPNGNLCGFIALKELAKLTGLAKSTIIHGICRLALQGRLRKYVDITHNGCFMKNYYEIID